MNYKITWPLTEFEFDKFMDLCVVVDVDRRREKSATTINTDFSENRMFDQMLQTSVTSNF